MVKKTILIFLIFTTLFSAVIYAQNPFLSDKNETKEEKKEDKNIVPYPSIIQDFIKTISKIQKNLHEKISLLAKQVNESNNFKILFGLLVIAFLYGIIHAIGPGHGKVIASSYFLSEDTNIKKGIITGVSIAYLHAGSGFTVVFIIYNILKSSFLTTVNNISQVIKIISYSLIILVGLFLLIQKLFFAKNSHESKHICKKSLLSLILAIGFIPCPGAVILTLFSISINNVTLGAFMVLAMASGMALTISVIGVLAIILKKDVLKIFSRDNKLQNRITKGIQLIGTLVIIFVGIILLIPEV